MTLEKKLRQFFLKYDPGRARMAKKIAIQFRGKDDEVMKSLTTIYAKGGPGGLLEAGAAPKKKKKKKKKEEVTPVMEAEESVLTNVDEEPVAEEAPAEEATPEEDSNKDAVESVIDDLDD